MTRQPSLTAGLIGHGIAGSLTPPMHEAEGRAHGLDYRYKRLDTALPPYRDQSLSQMLDEAERAGFKGLNITHPFKVQVLPLLDELSPEASAIGAVNTVRFRDGQRIGHNTDIGGFTTAFRSELPGVGMDHVLLLGAGGAGAAVAHALIALGARALSVISKEPDQTRGLLDALGALYPGCHLRALDGLNQTALHGVQGVVNATPMGMDAYPGTAIAPDLLRPDMWVSDIVYFPLETALLQEARAIGCRTMSGAGMAIHQAAQAFQIITGCRADVSRLSAEFDRLTTPDPVTPASSG
ncbi:shikimate dehydrogenase [Nioella aestuarii]|uniref:shikimate dehydrogenase n=1 Tax=Nioella aestuarii TaxID=1662864 RepID=UPI003D7FC8F5